LYVLSKHKFSSYLTINTRSYQQQDKLVSIA